MASSCMAEGEKGKVELEVSWGSTGSIHNYQKELNIFWGLSESESAHPVLEIP